MSNVDLKCDICGTANGEIHMGRCIDCWIDQAKKSDRKVKELSAELERVTELRNFTIDKLNRLKSDTACMRNRYADTLDALEDTSNALQQALGDSAVLRQVIESVRNDLLLVPVSSEPDTWADSALRKLEKVIYLGVGKHNVLRPEVLKFALAMEGELKANDHKGGWKDSHFAWLLSRLTEELSELAGEVYKFPKVKNPKLITKEAADVANFAMMIADVSGGLVDGN
jgi:NTP pyrophosphatase (non-canonical NTP hydrolase)